MIGTSKKCVCIIRLDYNYNTKSLQFGGCLSTDMTPFVELLDSWRFVSGPKLEVRMIDLGGPLTSENSGWTEGD